MTYHSQKNNRRKRGSRGILILLGLVVAWGLIFWIYHSFFGGYEGLGEKMSIAPSPYSDDAFYTEDGHMYYEDRRYTSVCGVDVSVFQGKIKWKKVRKQGIEFAMIRVGYRATDSGSIQADSMFQRNLQGAKAAGLDVGVYFFSQASTVEEAVEEAEYVIGKIRGKGISMPVAYDMEEMTGDRISGLTRKQRTEVADAFCTVIRDAGYVPMIYGSPKWLLTSINLGYMTRYPVWLAHYTDSTTYPFAFSMWQYSNTARIKGISKKTDLNIYFVRKQ